MTRILVTGANGFVGERLCGMLAADGFAVRAVARHWSAARSDDGVERVSVTGIDGDTDWGGQLVGVDAVIHLAARVHVMRDTEDDPLAAFRRVNVEGTLTLARAAIAAGVPRFVYVSSIKVNGEETLDSPYRETDPARPLDPYGLTKHEAEQALFALQREHGIGVSVVRPPLVLGPGARGNLAALIKIMRRGWPIPLGAVRNRRTMVGRDNLCALLMLCATHPAAVGEVFLAGESEPISTPDLLRIIGEAMGRSPRILAVPGWLMGTGLKLIGRGAVWRRLNGSLELESGKARRMLGWCEVTPWREEIRRMVEAAASSD